MKLSRKLVVCFGILLFSKGAIFLLLMYTGMMGFVISEGVAQNTSGSSELIFILVGMIFILIGNKFLK